MRDAFTSLTPRGRALLAGGVTVLVCAVVLGESILLAFGALCVGLPLAAVVLMARSRAGLTLSRHLSPSMVRAGQAATVTLRIANPERAPRGYLMLEDTLPFALGARPRFVLAGVRRGWQQDVAYQVRSDVRGRFELGPLTVRSSDPFGLVEIPRSFRVITPLVVTPRVVPLAALGARGRQDPSGDRRAGLAARGQAEDSSVRDYRIGDDLRRVHWRSSARTGELMVRREEQHSRASAVIVLDDRAVAHAGHGAASSLEAAVTVAASAAAHFSQQGWSVTLLTTSGTRIAARTAAELTQVMSALACTTLHPATEVEASVVHQVGRGSLVLVVWGRTQPADQPALRRLAASGSPALALQLDVATWTAEAPSTPDSTEAWAGWRHVPVRRDTSLAAAWQELSATSRGRTGAGVGWLPGGVQ